MPFGKDLELGGKAVEQLDAGLKKGPIIRIISVLAVCLVISMVFNIKLLLDSRDRELALKDETIAEIKRQVQEEVQPIAKQVNQTMVKMDSTLTKTDTILSKVGDIIKK